MRTKGSDTESSDHATASIASRRNEQDLEKFESESFENGENLEEQPTVKRVFTNKEKGAVDLPPDGGYGWIVVMGITLIFINSWGCNSAFGIFLSFYLTNNTYAGATKYDYALIAGLTVFLGQGLPPFVMVLARVIGMKPTMLIGALLLFAGDILASFSTRLWELYLTQGVMNGVAISLLFTPATTILPGWFLKKRAVSMGISLMGTGAGGVIYGLASNKMIQDNGNTKWCLRMLAITCTISNFIAIAIIKERNGAKPLGVKSWKPIKKEFIRMLSWKVIRTKPFLPLIAVWFTLALLGYNLMIFTLSAYAVARGMSAHNGSTLTAILNGCQVIGRPLMGLSGDKFGRANVTIALTFLLTIFMFAFWIPAHTFIQLIFFCIMVGSCVGVANVMNTVMVADLLGPQWFLSLIHI